MKKPQVIIMDFDRTITYLYKDTSLLIELADRIVNHYSKSFNIPQKYKEKKIDGYFVWHELHELTEKNLPFNISKCVNKKASEIVTDFELQIIKKIDLFDGITDSIKLLSELNIRLGIVSSNDTIPIKYLLEKERILDKFEYIKGRPYPFKPELVKPNPYTINEAINTMQAQKDETWYVGDDIIDIIAANLAGIISVGVCTGKYTREELLEVGADLIFSSFNDIIGAFN